MTSFYWHFTGFEKMSILVQFPGEAQSQDVCSSVFLQHCSALEQGSHPQQELLWQN